jgi:membrane-bound inhibitor of C-type lysozyme
MRALHFSLLASWLLAGCATHGHPGPAGIPYACDHGAARITYEGGGYYPRGTARLLYDGRETHLSAVPPTYGLRYVSEADASGSILVWSARGEEAWLSRLDFGQDERALAHCTRLRAGQDLAPAH